MIVYISPLDNMQWLPITYTLAQLHYLLTNDVPRTFPKTMFASISMHSFSFKLKKNTIHAHGATFFTCLPVHVSAEKLLAVLTKLK
jgi:hypothetical protein